MKRQTRFIGMIPCFPRGCGHPLPPLHRFPLAGLLLVVCLLGFGITQPVDVSAASMSEPAGLNSPSNTSAVAFSGSRIDMAWQDNSASEAALSEEPASVHARFDLNSVSGAPFPTDLYTVADPRSRTGRRVSMPLPDCSTRPSDCNDLAVVNLMDGFNLMPRISIPFDGEIDPTSVSTSSVFLVELAQQGEETIVANAVGINQVVWDPATLTLHVESDEVLRQTARYAVIVTNGIRDVAGRPVLASDDFDDFRHDLNYGQTKSEELKEYRKALISTLAALEQLGVSKQDVVAASAFTTETATATLENIRDYLKRSPTPAPANFAIGPGGSRAVFARSSLQTITFRQQTGTSTFVNAAVPLAVLNAYTAGAVSTVAWGTFVSPQYIDSNPVMTPHGTLGEVPTQLGEATLEFVLFLPSGTRPASGWPVAFLGHGGTTNIHTAAVWNFASSLAAHGFAAIAINAVGRGFGPLGTLIIKKTDGTTVAINAGGRTIDQDGNGIYVNQEGAAAQAPYLIVGQRDAVRQTAIDNMQLVRVIQAGIDVDGDGSFDLDAAKMVFLGNSFAVGYEMCFLAVEPDVGIAAVGSPGGLPGRNDLLSMRPSGRTMVGAALAARTPSLLNSAYGLTSLGGISATAPFYDENIPLRDLPPVINNIPGAMAIQEYFDRIEWVQAASDAATQAPHLEFEPLAGVPAKSILVLYAKGDMTAPNPRTTALVRAGLLREKTIFYRNDIAYAEDITVPKDPHTFLQPLTTAGIPGQVARGGQTTIGQFFASGGTTINHPEPTRFFEFPIEVLPEDYSYIP
ncbi:MAG: hypothetical protein AABZ10_07930 [Nitrospirota bacterium]